MYPAHISHAHAPVISARAAWLISIPISSPRYNLHLSWPTLRTRLSFVLYSSSLFIHQQPTLDCQRRKLSSSTHSLIFRLWLCILKTGKYIYKQKEKGSSKHKLDSLTTPCLFGHKSVQQHLRPITTIYSKATSATYNWITIKLFLTCLRSTWAKKAFFLFLLLQPHMIYYKLSSCTMPWVCVVPHLRFLQTG